MKSPGEVIHQHMVRYHLSTPDTQLYILTLSEWTDDVQVLQDTLKLTYQRYMLRLNTNKAQRFRVHKPSDLEQISSSVLNKEILPHVELLCNLGILPSYSTCLMSKWQLWLRVSCSKVIILPGMVGTKHSQSWLTPLLLLHRSVSE